MGRGAYEDMSRAWSGSENPMAVLMNTLPKVAYSQSVSEVSRNNARLLRAALADEIPALKRSSGRTAQGRADI